MDTGVERSVTGLGKDETRDGGGETIAGGVSDIAAAVKGMGGGETTRLGPSWGELGRMGSERETDSERWASVGVDGVIGNAAGVWDTGDGETMCFRGVWGKLGGWGLFWSCSGGSSWMFRGSGASVCRLEWSRAGDTAIVDGHIVDDVAIRVGTGGVVIGSGGRTGARGASQGGQERAGRLLDRS